MGARGDAGPEARLARYREMRDFGHTPEPRGEAAPAEPGSLRFVVQRHRARRLHYDFRLELDGVLKSWAIPKGPSLDPGAKRLAVETEDHPLEYADFEGTIPARQYGAGEVAIWDRGTWSAIDPDPVAALSRGKLKFRLAGERLYGAWTLVRTRARGDEDARNWLLIKDADEAARPGQAGEPEAPGMPAKPKRPGKADVPSTSGESDTPGVVFPDFLPPQLATLVSAPPDNAGWLWEVKYDGYRILARIEGDEVKLVTRSGQDWTARMPELAHTLAAFAPGPSWLDGEIVVNGPDGLPDFQALQNAFERGGGATILYYLFDAPWLDGKDLTRLPLAERKRLLAQALRARGGEGLGFSEHFAGDPTPALEQACHLGMEGLIGKRADAPYAGGRNRDWIKLKCRPRQEFVIGGYTDPAGTRGHLGALLVGLFDAGGTLQYAGRVGTGFDREGLADLARRLEPLRSDRSPFARPPRAAGLHWVRPTLVAEVAFAGWTRDGLLRQASFLGLREDKPAAAVHPETPASPDPGKPPEADAFRVGGVTITHPERVMWPDRGLTKGDLARYYEAVAEHLLPHLSNRPLSLLRCPGSSDAECFFQRHMGRERPPGVESFVWEESAANRRHYLYASSFAGVVGLVQRGVIEFHTWGSTLPRPQRPDRLTFDLDPAAGLPWEQVVEGALLVRGLLDELGLTSFLKTTGGKGLHLVVPLTARHTWDEAKGFSRAVAEHLSHVLPKRFTANMAKERRKGRIFIDYLRNDAGASAVAAFSVRARPGAPVSMPIAWEALGPTLDPAGFNVESVPAALAARRDDPWRDYASTRQALTRAMWQALGADGTS